MKNLIINVLKYFIYCWLGILVARSLSELIRDYGEGSFFYYPETKEAFVTLMVVVLITTILRAKGKMWLERATAWVNFAMEDQLFKGLSKKVGTVLVSLCLSLGAVYLTKSLVCNGGRAMAYGADLLGAYEIGEYIYSLTASSDGTSLAATLGSKRHDNNINELRSERLDKAVASIYGVNSLQMASRYYAEGCHYGENFHDDRAAEHYFKKAVKVYQPLNNANLLWPLASLSYVQYLNGESQSAKETLVMANELAERHSYRGRWFRAFDILRVTATMINDTEGAKSFGLTADKLVEADKVNSINVWIFRWSGLDSKPLFNYS